MARYRVSGHFPHALTSRPLKSNVNIAANMSLHVHRRTLCLHHRRKTIRTLNVFKLTQNHFRASTMTATTCFTKTVLILWKKLERHTSGRAGQRRRCGCSPAARSTTCGRRRWTSTWQTSPSRHPQTEPEKFESTWKTKAETQQHRNGFLSCLGNHGDGQLVSKSCSWVRGLRCYSCFQPSFYGILQ